MATPMLTVLNTMMGARMLGTMWRRMMVGVPTPMQRAAST